jgi:hypothetical protein
VALVFQAATRNATTAQMYYARKRRRARAEVTAGRNGGGMREQVLTFGVKMAVRLTLQ